MEAVDEPVLGYAHTSYQAEMGFEVEPGMTFRQTPPGQPRVPQLVGTGSVVMTNYGAGPYRVVALHEDRAMGYPVWSLECERLDRPAAWLNELVAVDGRLLHLFGNNPDEVRVKTGGQLALF